MFFQGILYIDPFIHVCSQLLPLFYTMDEAGFRLLFSVEADGNTSISKFKSNETGITVFIADVDGPLVNGYFCLGMPLTQKY